jgi:hypothetical protein
VTRGLADTRTGSVWGVSPWGEDMSSVGHNRAPVTLELTPEQAEFMLRNCDANITYGLAGLEKSFRDNRRMAEQLISMMEQFKEIRQLLLAQGVKADA